ncbi:MAG: folate-binding protein YgfZ [Actinomycetota bacterium]
MQPIDVGDWRPVLVTGTDALTWLNDLVSAGIGDGPVRSLLLTPTGRIRADFHVIPRDDGFLLLQDPVQPKPVDALLSLYVLSSDVTLSKGPLPTIAWEGDRLVPTASPVDDSERLDTAAFEVWRIREGIPRFGLDLDEDSLPQEAGWERFIDFTKGCFMGQEAMARIRNFEGHPTRVVRAMRASEPPVAGETVLADGKEVGFVTSSAGTDVIVRISWSAREAALRTAGGVGLSDRA